VSSEATSGGTLAPPLLLKFLVAGALSAGVVLLVPRTVSGSGDVPPVRMLIETAVIVSVICSLALYWGIRSDLGLPVKVALYAVVFNTLVIVVKLAIAPHGFYDVNQTHNLTSGFEIDDSFAAAAGAALIFALYAIVYIALYRFFRRRIAHIAVGDPVPRIPRGVAIALVVLVLLGIGSGGAILVLLLPLFGGLDYLDFVFSSGVSLLVALALAAATALAALAFDATSKRAHAVGDATLYMSFFWVGLYFLALYHVLWVVYVLVLTSIWPLKVVTPK
jgi:hypothetical protein